MTRRELFRLILAAPFVKIVKKSLENPYMSQAYENRLEMLYGGNAGGGKTDLLYCRIAKSPTTLISTREFRIPLTIRPGNMGRDK